MAPTSEEELGRRRFQLFKEQAVETAIEKIRHAPAAEWQSFSGTEYTRLRDLLGELWISIEREKWKEYSFSTLTSDDLRALLALGASAQGRALSRSTLEEMEAVLSHTRHSRSPV
jgi:hypothetical protein